MKKLLFLISIGLLLGTMVFVFAEGIPTQQQPIPNMGVQIAKGWNLVPRSYFFWGSSGDVNDCASNFKYGYFYDPYQKEYFGGKLQKMNQGPAPPGATGPRPSTFEFVDSTLNDRFARIFDGKLPGLDVMWVYSSADCSLDTGRELVRWSTSQKQFTEGDLQDIKNIQLFEGWNFFYIPDFWKDGDSLKDYLGNCDVTRVAMWDGHSQEWASEVSSMSTQEILTEFEVSPQVRASSLPVLLKVSQTCNLGYVKYGGNPSSPPGLPGGNGDESDCTDSDGGIILDIKGTMNLEIEGETVTASDNCAYDNVPDDSTSFRYIENYSCSGNNCYIQELNCDGYDDGPSGTYSKTFPCPNGCSNGACI